MMSLFGSQGSALSPAVSSDYVTVSTAGLKAAMQEIVDTRQANLAFRKSVSDHETAAVKEITSSKTPNVVVSAGRGGGGRGGGKGSGRLNRGDLSLKPPSARSVPRSVPRNIGNKVVWDKVMTRSTISTSTSAVTEQTYSFTLAAHPQASSWSALFDQWTIPQFSITWMNFSSGASTATLPELHTAIDFDNGTFLGSTQLIDDYGSAQVDLLIFNKSVTRSVKPCCKPDAGGASSALTAQSWVDCGSPNVPFYGIRSVFGIAATAGTTLLVEATIWYAFRNTI